MLRKFSILRRTISLTSPLFPPLPFHSFSFPFSFPFSFLFPFPLSPFFFPPSLPFHFSTTHWNIKQILLNFTLIDLADSMAFCLFNSFQFLWCYGYSVRHDSDYGELKIGGQHAISLVIMGRAVFLDHILNLEELYCHRLLKFLLKFDICVSFSLRILFYKQSQDKETCFKSAVGLSHDLSSTEQIAQSGC